MKFFVVLALLSCVFAGEVPSLPKGGLLVFPSRSVSEPEPTKTYATVNYDKDSLESVNERVMERLRQEVGSERGIYHVYLPDGRLQRVQYTAAPIRPQQPAQQKDIVSGSYRTFERVAQGFSSGLNAYYVQVPADRLDAILRSQAQPAKANYEGQSRNSNSELTAPTSYNQPLEVAAQFVPLQVVTPEQLAQLRNQL